MDWVRDQAINGTHLHEVICQIFLDELVDDWAGGEFVTVLLHDPVLIDAAFLIGVGIAMLFAFANPLSAGSLANLVGGAGPSERHGRGADERFAEGLHRSFRTWRQRA